MPRVVRALLACALALAGGVLAAGAAGGAGGAMVTDDSMQWRRCGDGIECTTLSVPADHDVPDGDRLDVAVARVPAARIEDRIGVLVVNPGGPGVSGVDRLGSLAESLPSGIRDRFDIVVYDPRGVGGSTAIDCATSLDDVFDTSFSPTDPAERVALTAAARAVADDCLERNGTLLGRVSTVDAARDLDVLRVALGERRLSFLGFSYGTYLGSLYAAQFPDRVRALVLDGAVDPGVDAMETVLLQARGFEQNLDAFLRDCAAREACPFHRDGRSAADYDALRARVASAPLAVSAGGDHSLNDTRFDAAVLQLLYGGRGAWDTLARALDEAERGDGKPLLAIADRFVGRRPGGGDDDTVEAFWAISCLDGPVVDGIDAMTGIESAVRAVAPRLGGFVTNFSLPCATWPVRGADAPSIVGAAPGALVVSSTRDPATPLVSAKRLARTLGDASLVVLPGDRHTAFAGGSDCVDEAVTDYLLSPRDPRPHTIRC